MRARAALTCASEGILSGVVEGGSKRVGIGNEGVNVTVAPSSMITSLSNHKLSEISGVCVTLLWKRAPPVDA
jgi:hypothetical protein